MCQLAKEFDLEGNEDNWNCDNESGYPIQSECDWSGVHCDGELVTSVSLPNLNINATIPSYIYHLSALSSLVLSGNKLHGSLPTALGLLSQLRYLDLSKTALTGTIPSSLHYLSNAALNFAWTHLSGSIPSSLCDGKLAALSIANSSFICYAPCLSTVPKLSPGDLIDCNQSKCTQPFYSFLMMIFLALQMTLCAVLSIPCSRQLEVFVDGIVPILLRTLGSAIGKVCTAHRSM